jgi:hypothetical protein
MMKWKMPKIKFLLKKGILFSIIFVLLGPFLSPVYSFPENIEQKFPGAQQPVPSDRVPVLLKDKIFLVMKADRTQAYLHEIFTVTIQLFFRGVTLRDIQYPQLSHQYFSIREFDPPVEKRETRDGLAFEVIEFKTTLFGKKNGNFKMGPSRLQCKLPMAKQDEGSRPLGERTAVDNYFGTSEHYPLNLESADIPFKIVPLPGKGKPSDFHGAVGSFDFTMGVHPREAKVGEPITLKMVIEGKGNFDTLVPPHVEKGNLFKGYQPRVTQEKDRMIYEQVLIPQSEAVREIPIIRFSFFDPEKGSYQTLGKGPLPIKIMRPDLDEDQKMSGKPERVGENLITVKGSPGKLRKKGASLYKNTIFLLLQLLPLLLFSSLALINKRKMKLKTDLRYARRQKAKKIARKGIQKAERILKKEGPIEFYDTLFKTLQDYLGNRFYLPSRSMTGEVVDEVLKPKGVDGETTEKLQDLFLKCDRVRYAASGLGKSDMEETLTRLKEVISYLENRP